MLCHDFYAILNFGKNKCILYQYLKTPLTLFQITYSWLRNLKRFSPSSSARKWGFYCCPPSESSIRLWHLEMLPHIADVVIAYNYFTHIRKSFLTALTHQCTKLKAHFYKRHQDQVSLKSRNVNQSFVTLGLEHLWFVTYFNCPTFAISRTSHISWEFTLTLSWCYYYNLFYVRLRVIIN